ncbi:MAG: ABC transporter substrate-binding protein, partial [Hyphomicrobium sp.]
MIIKTFETVRPFILAVLLILSASWLLLYLDNSNKGARNLPHIAIVQHASVAALEEGVEGMLQGLAKQGFVDGKTITVQKFNAQSDIATANDIAAQVTNGSFDLIITSSTPSLQAVANKNAKAHVKHVYGVVTDAASSGVGVSKDDPLAHPPYMTGISSKIPVLRAIKIALEANPQMDSIGLVWHNAEINSQIYTEDTRRACSELGITLLEATIDNSAGVGEAARSLVARGVDALFIT